MTSRGRAAVYNQFWETGGGGETFCGGIAQALAEAGYEVSLLSHRTFDRDALGERLSLDLSQCSISLVDGNGPRSVSAATEGLDLFVNGSYLSSATNRARAGIYVVHFPGSPPPPIRFERARRFLADNGPGEPVDFTWGEGFYARDGGSGRAMWTSARADLHIRVGGADPMPVTLNFAHLRPPEAGPAEVTLAVDGTPAATGVVPAGGGGVVGKVRNRLGTSITAEVPPGSHTLSILTDPYVPAEHGGGDTRALGVALVDIHNGSPLAGAVATVAPGVWHKVSHRGTEPHLESYDVIASNSEFTQHFVEAWWRIESSPVLYPPVILREPSTTKTSSIAAVGRFFAADAGHSKKQLEMVRAFRRLRATGVEGWTLHLVGGCSPAERGYLAEVQAAAEGAPVEFHIDASGAERDRVMAEASIFWHATGLGENADTHPERMEHFGISTVEAMSTGAAPVVYAGGGQLEIVEHGVSGFHFRTLDELVDHTRTLIGDADRRAAVGAAAATRARDFGFPAFSERLLDLVDLATERSS